MSSTSGFFPPRTSPTCVRSLAGRLEQEAQFAAAETKQQHREESVTLAAALQGRRMAAANSSHEAGNTTVEINLRQSRNSIFRLAALAGQASALFLDEEEDDDEEHERGGAVAAANNKTRTEQALARILIALMNSAKVMNVDLEKACHAKIDLNCKKYPVDLCKGKDGKYTEYSTSTGITKSVGQITACAATNGQKNEADEDTNDWTATFLEYAVPALSLRAQRFAADRDWLPYHTPRNILMALLGELGELAELLQFKGDDGSAILPTATELNKISQELADVTIYLLRLADVTGTDIGLVALGLQDLT